ncbi:ferritin-like domain-containing protein [Zunongwangia sp. F363]|uniref:Ferritin-like domain-containing protein n=1 Tax=Autumnicola tepida TaxID=3075595 RepID=A0ABU3C972_9FLAO|nr:ferritin-like domain-containing protein [Zunongwangia sp. F363]MDT0642885.1 ferritin-like domain-containing protein [Zunongwangia sp. F363]
MKFIKLLENLADKESLAANTSRRDAFKQFKNIGKDVALASIPFGLAATSSKTKAATAAMSSAMFQASPTNVLNFALTLEYLERNFYRMALDTDGLIPDEHRDVFAQISKHEDDHVEFLMGALGDDAIAEPTFDFTGKGLNLDTFSNYQTFLALSQGFEDTGVRAYKGQAGALMDDDDLLTYALQIHSVEARHASQVRRMRGEKGWIVQNNTTIPDAFAGIYAGEQNTEQGGVDLAGMFDDFGGNDAITAAFDEPLTMDEVNAIASNFIVMDSDGEDSED